MRRCGYAGRARARVPCFGVTAVALTLAALRIRPGTSKYSSCLEDRGLLLGGRFIMFWGVIRLKVGRLRETCYSPVGQGVNGDVSLILVLWDSNKRCASITFLRKVSRRVSR